MQCRICNKVVGDQAIASHLKLHNKKYQDYVEEFYDKFKDDFKVWARCEICQKLSKQGNTCSREHGFQLRSIRFPEGNHHIPHSFKTRNEMSKIRKGKLRSGYPENWKHSEETKKFLSEQAITKKLHAGKNNGMYGKTHTPEAVKKIFSYRKINKLEQLVYNKLTEAKIKFTFQYPIEENNICKFYDFRIDNTKIVVEVDGDFWHGNPNCKGYIHKEKVQKNDKFKEQLAKSKGFKILRFWESDIKANPDIVVKVVNSLMP